MVVWSDSSGHEDNCTARAHLYELICFFLYFFFIFFYFLFLLPLEFLEENRLIGMWQHHKPSQNAAKCVCTGCQGLET